MPETFYANDQAAPRVIVEARIALAIYAAVAVISLWTRSDRRLDLLGRAGTTRPAGVAPLPDGRAHFVPALR